MMTNYASRIFRSVRQGRSIFNRTYGINILDKCCSPNFTNKSPNTMCRFAGRFFFKGRFYLTIRNSPNKSKAFSSITRHTTNLRVMESGRLIADVRLHHTLSHYIIHIGTIHQPSQNADMRIDIGTCINGVLYRNEGLHHSEILYFSGITYSSEKANALITISKAIYVYENAINFMALTVKRTVVLVIVSPYGSP